MRILTLVLFIILTVFPQKSHSAEKRLFVAAAADLTFALNEIAKGFEMETGTKTALSFGSTGMLALQIENGAPFDVFFAANEKYIDRLGQKGLIVPETRQLYAQGRIILAVNKKSGAEIKMPLDLLNPSIKRITIANPDHAPYGIAAKEALQKLGLWDRLKSKLVYGENIRQTLQFIQTGNAQAGIIALSVASVPEIEWTLIDNNLHNPINQAAAVIKTSKIGYDALEFIKYVNSPKGRLVMKKYGFLLPEAKDSL